MNDPGTKDPRTIELATNLARVREELAEAAVKAGREPSSVTLVAVTKTWPAADVRRLAELGVADVGENRDQEAAPKASACRDVDVRWHFIGQLQTNKVRSVATYADVVHAVDRVRLVGALDRAAVSAGRRLRVLLQVSLALAPAPDGGRGGAAPSELSALADAVLASAALDLGGVMGVAPLGDDPAAAFARLADASEDLRTAHPGATWVSAGMSADFVQAIEHGATHVRIGSALLGNRSPLR
ncbi:MAG TPA: YggS family pyridoxal phosphate-dependent enzyme [Candidatus Limnocylindria bacterium]|nr:YggS family pyridoxal phosphate-dependent enzyme [Candidatus Limnocylindria bacterium]